MDSGMNQRDRVSAQTRRANVWKLLSDGEWHSTMEINAVDIGGSEGCRRVRELRRECRIGARPGWEDIECRRRFTDSTQWEYQAVRVLVEQNSWSSVRQRLAELQRVGER